MKQEDIDNLKREFRDIEKSLSDKYITTGELFIALLCVFLIIISITVYISSSYGSECSNKIGYLDTVQINRGFHEGEKGVVIAEGINKDFQVKLDNDGVQEFWKKELYRLEKSNLSIG